MAIEQQREAPEWGKVHRATVFGQLVVRGARVTNLTVIDSHGQTLALTGRIVEILQTRWHKMNMQNYCLTISDGVAIGNRVVVCQSYPINP